MKNHPMGRALPGKTFCLWILVSLSTVFAQDAVWENLLSSHQQRLDEGKLSYDLALVRLKKSYHGALEGLMPAAQKQGDLKYFVAIEEEINRTSQTPSVPRTLSVYPDLAKVQGILVSELKRLEGVQAVWVDDLYNKLDVALAGMRQTLVQNGRISEAKAVEEIRATKMSSDEYLDAKALAATVEPPGKPPAENPSLSGSPLASIQKMFAGKVSTYNPVSREIEVVYGFDKESELADFEFARPESYTVKDGKLEITVRELTVWWWTMEKMVCDYMVIPFLEVDHSLLVVQMSEHQDGINYHIAFGYSDLQKKTIGGGPLFVNNQFTVEGWTPKDEELERETFGIPNQYPATLTLEKRGNKIDFEMEAGGRKKTLKVRTDDSLTHLGIFPKSWGKGGGGLSKVDELRVRGILSQEWLKERAAGN